MPTTRRWRRATTATTTRTAHDGRPSRSLLRTGVVALSALALLATGCSADEGTTPDEAATTTASAPAGALLVVDVEALTLEEQLTFAALQGIVNRDQPTLYLVGLRSAQDFEVDPSAEAWLRDAVDLPTERVDPDEALRRLLGRTGGLVVWDPDEAVVYESQDVATTIAGLEDLVPVDPATADRLVADFDVEVVQDLRDLELTTPDAVITWALENLDPAEPYPFPVWTGRPRNGKPIQPGLRDWAVMHRAFVFDADPSSERGLLDRVLAEFPPGTPVYGYPFFDTELYLSSGLPLNEAISAAAVAEAGHWLVPTTDAANLSVHVHLGDGDAQVAWDDEPRTPDGDTTYVTFTISDGDAMGYVQTLLRHLHLDAMGPDTIPIGISTSPYLATDAPALWDWLVANAPEQVRWVTGPSGGGYAYPYAMADLDGYLDHSRAMTDPLGLRATWILEPPLTASPSQEIVERFAVRTEPSLLLTDYGGSPPNPPTVAFVGDVPVVRTVQIANRDMDMARIIRGVADLQPPGARFVSIGLTTWGVGAEDAAAAMAELGDGYEVVAPDTFAGLLRGAHAAGYTGSGESAPTPPAPEAGACRAIVVDLDGTGDPFARRYLSRLLAQANLAAGVQLERTGPEVVTARFDTEALAAAADAFAQNQLRLGYGQAAVDTVEVALALRGLRLAGTDLVAEQDLELQTAAPDGIVGIELRGGAAPADLDATELTATLEVAATWNPGDREHEVGVSGPVACRSLAG